MPFAFKPWNIAEVISDAIAHAELPLVRAAQDGQAMHVPRFGDTIHFHAAELERLGIHPKALADELGNFLQRLTGSEVDIVHPPRRFFGYGKVKPNSRLTLHYASNEAVCETLQHSDHPVIKAYREARTAELAAEEARALAAQREEQQAIEQALKAQVEAAAKAERYKGLPIVDGVMNPKALCVTHTTKHMPIRNSDGSVEITTHHMINPRLPRNSSHFALNHRVSSHAYGSWEMLLLQLLRRMKQCRS